MEKFTANSTSIQRYSSEFMRQYRNVGPTHHIPDDIIRQFPQNEYYDVNGKFNPDQMVAPTNRLARDVSSKSGDGGVRETFIPTKDDASLQPQRRPWTRGCIGNTQGETDAQGSAGQGTSTTASSKIQPIQSLHTSTTSSSSNVPSGVRQGGVFSSGSRPVASGLQAQSSLRPNLRGGPDFGQGYATAYKPARDPQDFRPNRPPFGRGRGIIGRGYDDHDHRIPPLFQQSGMRGGAFSSGHRSAFGQKRHGYSGSDNVPEWFSEGPSDASVMMELGGELPSSSRSSSPAQSSGEEIGGQLTTVNSNSGRMGEVSKEANEGAQAAAQIENAILENPNPEKQSIWEAGDKDRPASQQLDYTYFLWSSLHNDLSSLGEPATKGGNDAGSTAEITGSRLFSVWKEMNSSPHQGVNEGSCRPRAVNQASSQNQKVMLDKQEGKHYPQQMSQEQQQRQQQQSSVSQGLNLRDWLENASERMSSMASQQPQITEDAVSDAQGESKPNSGSSAPRGLNPNELFAKFSISNGNNLASTVGQTVPAAGPTRKSPPAGQMLSVEDLERRLMKKSAPKATPLPGDKHSEMPDRDNQGQPKPSHAQQRGFYDPAPPLQQQSYPMTKVPQSSDDSSAPSTNAPITPSTLQMQLAAAQQAMMNAAANATTSGHGSGGPNTVTALQQQKMLFSNLLQQQHQHFGPYLAAAAAAAAAATSNQSSTNVPANPGLNGSSSGSTAPPSSVPPMFGMYPPNALAAAAAAAAQSASSPLFYYPHLLQQASRLPGSSPPFSQSSSNAAPPVGPGGTNAPPLRPPFPFLPPGGALPPGFPPNLLNPTTAAGLMAAALSHFQQQQHGVAGAGKSSPGPTGNMAGGGSASGGGGSSGSGSQVLQPQPQHPSNSQSLPGFPNASAAAAAAAATALMAGRVNPPGGFSGGQQGASTGGYSSNVPLPPGGYGSQQLHSGSAADASSGHSYNHGQANMSMPSSQMQQHQQHQGGHINSPPHGRAPSPLGSASNSSKLGASFVPTQVMMKNPQTAVTSSPDVSVSTKNGSHLNKGIAMNAPSGQVKPGNFALEPQSPASYSSVAAVGTVADSASNTTAKVSAYPQTKSSWNAEDLERPFMKPAAFRATSSSSSSQSYASYPPLQQQQQQMQQVSGHRTAGIAAAAAATATTAGHNNRNRFQDQRLGETAHQFSVADLLRGAANATNKASQPSSTGFGN